MQYINPFDLLGITTENLSDVNSYSINKSKRQLIAEIELSDTNTIIHDGIELNKGDCIKIIDELDNKDSKEFHFFIYQNKLLKEFLTSGNLYFFEYYKTESIYNLPEFIDFISPYFSEQLDKALLECYKDGKLYSLKKILSIKPIVNALYYEKCFKTIYSYIKEIDNVIKTIISEISSGKSSFINKQFVGLDLLIIEKVNIDLLNLLPSYFQNLRNQLAMSIRNLARDINNKPFEYFEPAFRIIEVAYNISIDALTKQTISKGYFVIKKNYEEEVSKQEATQRENENRRIITKWTEKENQIEHITKEIIEGNSKFISANFLSLDILILQIVQPYDLNLLTKNFQGLRNRIAENIRALAKAVNNEPYHNYKVAFDIIDIAKNIIVEEKISWDIDNTYQIIQNNLEKQIGIKKQQNTTPSWEKQLENANEVKLNNEWLKIIETLKTIEKNARNQSSFSKNSNILTLDSLIRITVDVSLLNSFSSEFDNIRKNVAEVIMNIAKIVNSEPLQNHNIALKIISIAYNINTIGLTNLLITDLKENIEEQISNTQKQNTTHKAFDTDNHKENNNPISDFILNSYKQLIKVISEKTIVFNLFIIIFLGFLIWALTDETIQTISLVVLSIKLAYKMLVNYAINHSDTLDNEKENKTKEFIFFTLVCIVGFFIYQFAVFYITYNLLIWGYRLYCRLRSKIFKKNRDITIAFISIAFLITLLLWTNNTLQNTTSVTSNKTTVNQPIVVNSTNNSNYQNPSADNTSGYSSSNNTNTPSEPITETAQQPIYSYPSMANGNIKGCSNIQPQYDKNLKNRLVVSSGSNADAAVKMIDYSTDKSIRYVYIHKNTTYTIRNIPEGRYYLKIAYGDYWAIKQGESICEGRFTTHTVFEKGKDILDYNLRLDSEGSTQVPSYSLKLNVIFHDNDLQMKKFRTNNISEKEFYNE